MSGEAATTSRAQAGRENYFTPPAPDSRGFTAHFGSFAALQRDYKASRLTVGKQQTRLSLKISPSEKSKIIHTKFTKLTETTDSKSGIFAVCGIAYPGTWDLRFSLVQ